MKVLDLRPRGEESFDVHYAPNGVNIGLFYKEVDGYYVWAFDSKGGCWESYILRAISDRLDELNAAWDAEIKAFFEEPSSNS